ncbi:MAG TPA: YihY/virulence factor BrkB family protein, partial [Aggregatilineales bacterium]|nr:YihY/virulence factor BrkB family protein [Aggregatilineales bacterium]
MKFKLKDLFPLFKETIKQYSEDKISRLAAALAYYTVFSLAPMLIIAIAIAGFVWGEEAARGQLLDEIAGLVGEDAAGMVQTMIQNASSPGRGIVATIIGVVTLILGATGAFTQLQAALNQVWDVPEEQTRGGIMGMLLSRLLSFGMVLSIAFLLLVSLVVSAAVSA